MPATPPFSLRAAFWACCASLTLIAANAATFAAQSVAAV